MWVLLMLFEREPHEFCLEFECNLRVRVCMTKRFIKELTLNNIITARRPPIYPQKRNMLNFPQTSYGIKIHIGLYTIFEDVRVKDVTLRDSHAVNIC